MPVCLATQDDLEALGHDDVLRRPLHLDFLSVCDLVVDGELDEALEIAPAQIAKVQDDAEVGKGHLFCGVFSHGDIVAHAVDTDGGGG